MTNKVCRISTVAEKTTLGKSTIWLKVREGKFPKPFKLSEKVTVWRESEIDDFLNAKKKNEIND